MELLSLVLYPKLPEDKVTLRIKVSSFHFFPKRNIKSEEGRLKKNLKIPNVRTIPATKDVSICSPFLSFLMRSRIDLFN
jgi:hypothetical protein